MYTDEPMHKKDVALGQNFSRFSLLTKITVFGLLRYPMLMTGKVPVPAFEMNGNPSLKVYTGKRIINPFFIMRKVPANRPRSANPPAA